MLKVNLITIGCCILVMTAPLAGAQDPPIAPPPPSVPPPTTPTASPLSPEQKAAQADARQSISTMNAAQQGLYTRSQFFGNTVSTLQTEGNIQVPRTYNFAVRATQESAFQYAVPRTLDLKAYVGAVFLKPAATNANKPEFLSIICRAKEPGNARPADPIVKEGQVRCGENSAVVSAPQPAPSP
jgi:Type IV pilin-like G and H, putative